MLLLENISDANKKIKLEIISKGYISQENSFNFNGVNYLIILLLTLLIYLDTQTKRM